MGAVELVWDSRCETGESCVWDARNRRVLFADMHAGKILAYGVDDKSKASWAVAQFVGSFGMCRSGRVVVGTRHHVILFDPKSGKSETLAEIANEPETHRLNDGKVGPDGCFWVGSTDSRPDKPLTGSLYRVTPEGKVELKSEGYLTTNGLAWTPDGKLMFHTDSRKGAIDVWDFDAKTGIISNRRRVATLTDPEGRPDGGACDAEGCYWSAGVSGGCLNRFTAEGKLLARIPFPVPAPTMPCFTDNSIFITSLRRGRSDEDMKQYPTSGGLFRMDAPVPGSEVSLFSDS